MRMQIAGPGEKWRTPIGSFTVEDYQIFAHHNGKIFCRYRWFADDDNRVTITFEKQTDGTLTWNVTAWDGLK